MSRKVVGMAFDSQEAKGISLVFLTALVSGASIFLNKYAVSMADAVVFTTLKNVSVAAFLVSILFFAGSFGRLSALSKRAWAKLALVGAVGGSVPFLLFFQGLSLTSAAGASFVHKTMFVWVAVLAAIFLKEKLNAKLLAAAGLLMAANLMLFGIPSLNEGILLVFAATLFWSAETVMAKKFLEEFRAEEVMFGRMFFGSLVMLGFLAATGKAGAVLELSSAQAGWVLFTALLLLAYVWTWFKGLQLASATTATMVLLLGSPITTVLELAFSAKAVSLNAAIGTALIVLGVVAAVGVSELASVAAAVPRQLPFLAKKR